MDSIFRGQEKMPDIDGKSFHFLLQSGVACIINSVEEKAGLADLPTISINHIPDYIFSVSRAASLVKRVSTLLFRTAMANAFFVPMRTTSSFALVIAV